MFKRHNVQVLGKRAHFLLPGASSWMHSNVILGVDLLLPRFAPGRLETDAHYMSSLGPGPVAVLEPDANLHFGFVVGGSLSTYVLTSKPRFRSVFDVAPMGNNLSMAFLRISVREVPTQSRWRAVAQLVLLARRSYVRWMNATFGKTYIETAATVSTIGDFGLTELWGDQSPTLPVDPLTGLNSCHPPVQLHMVLRIAGQCVTGNDTEQFRVFFNQRLPPALVASNVQALSPERWVEPWYLRPLPCTQSIDAQGRQHAHRPLADGAAGDGRVVLDNDMTPLRFCSYMASRANMKVRHPSCRQAAPHPHPRATPSSSRNSSNSNRITKTLHYSKLA